MTGDKKIVGLWRDRDAGDAVADMGAGGGDILDAAVETTAVPCAPPPNGWLDAGSLLDTDVQDETALPVTSAPVSRVTSAVLTLLAMGWLALVIGQASDNFAHLPALGQVPQLLSVASGPLILLALIQIARLLSGKVQLRRFAHTAAQMRLENGQLQASLAGLTGQLDLARRALHDQAQSMQQLGLDAAARLHDGSSALTTSMERIAQANNSLQQSGDAAMQRMQGLLAGLPRVDAVAMRLADNFREAGKIAHQQGASLEEQLAQLGERSAATQSALADATLGLSDQLVAIEAQSSRVLGQISDGTEQAAIASQAQLAAVHAAQDDAQVTLTTMLATLATRTTEISTKLASDANAAGDHLDRQLERAAETTGAIGAALTAHGDTAGLLVKNLASAVTGLAGQLATLDENAGARATAISGTLTHLAAQISDMDAHTLTGQGQAEQLLVQSDRLLVALDAVAREVDESLPGALERLRGFAGETATLTSGLHQPIAQSVKAATAAADGLRAARSELDQLTAGLAAASASEAQLNAAIVDDLGGAEARIADLFASARSFADHGSGDMLTALDTVRETAAAAANDARAAIDSVIAEASDTMQKRAAGAIEASLKTEIGTQLAAIEAAADRAVSAANSASDRLMRQLITIMDTSASIEARIAETENAIASTDRDTLARQVAVLTESLKSTAIDLTKILSVEVSDAAWDGYLKGDRGVFSRRAVRLIDNGDAREILKLYQSDDAFHGHVNRYIHDFEAILRAMMGTRDGSALSVTMLSSDVGKLYVALAQAIDRLRN